jgi:hypothetical protein
MVQAIWSSQLVGQLPSHVSPGGSTTLFPHVAEQALSFVLLHPRGQHVSLLLHMVIAA